MDPGRLPSEIMIRIFLTITFGFISLLIDAHFENVILTPFLSLTWLMWMARTQGWKQVTVIFIVLACFVVFSLIGENALTIVVRASGFCLTGTLAVAFSRARQRAEDTLASTHAIIRAIPTPIVVADMTGSIVAASDEIERFVSKEFQPVVGHSFADVFLGHLPPGRAMKKYLDWFHMEGTRDENLYLRSEPHVPILASILTTGEGGNRLLVAAIHESSA